MIKLRCAFWTVTSFLCAAALAACSGGGAGAPSIAPINGNQAPPPPPSGGTAPYTYTIGPGHVQKVLTAGETTAIKTNSPFDLTNAGGPVLKTVVSHDVDINCAATCWGTTGRGTAASFLRNLSTSNFIHIVDQYTGSTANGRYTVAADTSVKKTLPNPLMVSDLVTLVHDAAIAAKSTGYGNELHLFLPKGQDVCLSSTSCYSPDNPSTFAFCAFHNSVTFSDIGHVIFSVEPYQFVEATPSAAGCYLPGNAPNGVIDATSSTLSHELVESITDPDGDAWFNQLFGIEIGDECFTFRNLVQITATYYDIQSEYSNAAHACVNGV